MCGEPGDGAGLAQQPVADRRHPSVADAGVTADSGEVRRRNVGEACVCRRHVELAPQSLQCHSLDERQHRVDRSLTPHHISRC